MKFYNKCGHWEAHGTRAVRGRGMQLRNLAETVEIKPKPRIQKTMSAVAIISRAPKYGQPLTFLPTWRHVNRAQHRMPMQHPSACNDHTKCP